MFYSIVGVLCYLLAFGSGSQTDGDCRSLEFKTTIDGRALFGHVVKKFPVNTQDDCELKCYLEAECMSINIGPGDDGVYQCELSDSDYNSYPEDLKQRDGFAYRPTVKNVCVSNPCPMNSRCQTGFTDKGYRCICSVGFTGEDCTIEILLGKIPWNPGDSCKHILESGFTSAGNGEYWIDPEHSGNPLKVYCDMTTDGGGWLLVANFVIANPSNPPKDWKVESSHRGISNYHKNNMGITRSSMKELRSQLPFTQLRFHCSKRKGRTFHVTTVANSSGEAVVQYFSGQTDEMPSSCSSFRKAEDDDSELAVQCDLWGIFNGSYHVGKWGNYKSTGGNMMYNDAARIANKYRWNVRNGKWQCDDHNNHEFPISPGDFWKIYVR